MGTIRHPEELTEGVNMIIKGRICAVAHPRLEGVRLCVEFWVLHVLGGALWGSAHPHELMLPLGTENTC